MNKSELKRRMIEEEFTEFVRDLGTVLKGFEPCEFRQFCQKYRNWIPESELLMIQSDNFLLTLICKLIGARNNMTPQELQMAKDYLADLENDNRNA